MLSKSNVMKKIFRQENKQAIRRVVQPKFVDTTNTKQDKPESKQSDNLTEKTSSIVSNDVTSENANLAAKTASEPVIQVL